MVSTRRSARLAQPSSAVLSAQSSTGDEATAVSEISSKSKELKDQKAARGKDSRVHEPPLETKPLNGKKRPGPKVPLKSAPVQKKIKKPSVPTSSGDDLLSSLPPEILDLVLGNVKDGKTLNALSQISKAYYAVMMPQLYRRVAVSAAYHAHIAKLIRRVQGHLTIAQNKQLKKEGKYKGQRESYPTKADAHAKPFCVSLVRQLVVGRVDPGRKHRYIVDRYIEELMKNLENLEAFETWVLTSSVAESIASMKNLKALNLFLDSSGAEDLQPLAQIKNLKHLVIRDHDWSSGYNDDRRRPIQAMILNSAATLETLKIENQGHNSGYLLIADRGAEAMDPSSPPVLAALKSLHLHSYSVEKAFIEVLPRAIDFLQLTQLTFGPFDDMNGALYRKLAALFQASSTKPKLRKLQIDMDTSGSLSATPSEERERLNAQMAFISSFDTLADLDIEGYGRYALDLPNPGLDDTIIDTILSHRHLTALRITYTSTQSGRVNRRLLPRDVKRLAEGLEKLEKFEFALDADQTRDICEALAPARNLVTLDLSYAAWNERCEGELIASHALHGLLDGARGGDADDFFVWDREFKLRRIVAHFTVYCVSSDPQCPVPSFAQRHPKRPHGKPVLKTSTDGTRSVYYRRVEQRMLTEEDLEYRWMDMIDNHQ
ncbi:hypothetical protein F4778DRAFT_351447 [Xylariomycetidae sp. FL2044]|nr:hypothetical protein F4778DRAFT_351447 [Xylariomycetidae sp. FL2044]